MITPKYCLFYDNHTMRQCPDVGSHFDVEAFTDQLGEMGVDFLTIHARCNQGFTYYDTEIGTKHPSLKDDLFGKFTDACRRKGIGLSAYFNAGVNNEEGIQHRDWLRVHFDGREYREPRTDPFVRILCFNTPYRDHMIAMILEVARKYPVDGFFIDCIGSYPCICPTCVRGMKERNMDWTNREEVVAFSRESSRRFGQDIANALSKVHPEYLLYFNGIGYEDQLAFSKSVYLECECLPTGGWGYDYLPIRAHYMRTLTKRPIVNMTGRFYGWGDFGGLRPEAAIKFELLYGLAHGMRPNIGDHFHPRGDLPVEVFEQNKKIYQSLQQLEPWIEGAENLADIGLVYSGEPEYINGSQPLKGAVRMLGELKQQFDIIRPAREWKDYKVIILPDDVTGDEALKNHLQAHLQKGGFVISAGSAGLNADKTDFLLPDVWGLDYIGPCDWIPAYYVHAGKEHLMPRSLYAMGNLNRPGEGTEVLARLVKPYYNREWDGESAVYYCPPDKVSDYPALSVKGQVAHFSHQLFTGYHKQASVVLRELLADVLGRFLPESLVTSEGFPSFSRMFVTEQVKRRIVHIFNYVPELRGEKIQMIEDPVSVVDGKVSLRTDGKTIKRVYLAPEAEECSFASSEGRVAVQIPHIAGYAALVFEEE